MTQALLDRASVGLSRAITRRRFMARTMRWGLGAGAALSNFVVFADEARAITCPRISTNWGCYCASTPSCGSNKCKSNGNCKITAGADPRCNYWGSPAGTYCWCSPNCCVFQLYGYYSCCDCWKYGDNGSCGSGNTACICVQRILLREC